MVGIIERVKFLTVTVEDLEQRSTVIMSAFSPVFWWFVAAAVLFVQPYDEHRESNYCFQ